VYRGPGEEARAERTVETLLEEAVVGDDIARIIRPVSHHDGHGISLEHVEARSDGHPEAVAVARRPMQSHGRQAGAEALDRAGGPVAGGIVDNDDLVVDVRPIQRGHHALDRLLDGALFVVGGYDDRELHGAGAIHRSTFASWISCSTSSIPYVGQASGGLTKRAQALEPLHVVRPARPRHPAKVDKQRHARGDRVVVDVRVRGDQHRTVGSAQDLI